MRADEVSAAVLRGVGPRAAGEVLVEAIRRFLRDRQPWLAERVEVQAEGEEVMVVPRSGRIGERRAGERPLELLRSVEGVLGMADKLPEFSDTDELAEVSVEGHDFGLPAAGDEVGAPAGAVRLRSKVRYFPLPVAEWFEVCEGELVLTLDGITFKPRYRIEQEEEGRSSRMHAIPIASVTGVARDTWLHVPCLRVETLQGAYRYGWAPRREELESCFDIAEWRAKLEALVQRGRRP